MKIKAKDLIGPALDWAVAKCEVAARGVHPGYLEIETFLLNHRGGDFCYSTDWSQGGPIIEQLQNSSKHQFLLESDGENVHILSWPSEHVHFFGYGPTPLIAVMRCYASSKLGDEVEVPEELMESTQRSEK